MDNATPDPLVIAAELRILGRLNRATASGPALVDAIRRRIAPSLEATVRLLDIGCGDGFVGRHARDLAQRDGWRLELQGIDRLPQCVAACRAADQDPASEYREGDIRDAERVIGTASCDVAHASLALHHLRDAEVAEALRHMGRSARRLVVWNDLLRETIGEIGARIVTLGAPRAVRRDAVRSVRRGFTLREAEAFAEAAGLVDIEVRRWRGGRFVLTAVPTPEQASARPARPVLRATGVGRSIRGRTILAGTTVSFAAGSVALIEGRNGCGKSTLLRILSGADRPTTGRVWRDATLGPVGYLPQQGGLLPMLSTRDNIALAQRLSRVPVAERPARARAAAARLGADLSDARPVAQLSIGQSRRAALATVLASASGLVLLDEPDAGLDADGRAALLAAVGAHCRAGGCVVIATHHPDEYLDALRAEGVSVTRSTPR